MNNLTAVSLFAGIGGFDEALRRCGVHVTAAVEIDPACRGEIARHFPGTALFNDVTEVTCDQLRATGFVPEHGIVTGGWPCQDLSLAGRRAGLGGARSGLFWEIVRLADEMRPRWLVLENVDALLSSHGGRDMGTVVRALEQLGYGLCWRVLDAQFFGVPQRRNRLFFAGCLGDGASPAEVLFEPEGGAGDPAPGGQEGPGAAGRTARSAGSPGTAGTLQGGGRRGYRIDAEGAAGGHLLPVPVAVRGRGGGSRIEAAQPGDPAFTIRTPNGGSSYPMIAHALTAEGTVSEDGTGRGTPLIAAGQAVRRLTPRECERLQGFPDDWTAGQSDSARYRQIGNAVPVPVAEWIVSRIVAAAARHTARSRT